MDAILAELLKYGLPGVMLCVFIWLYLQSQAKADARSIDERRECRERHDKLEAKIDAQDSFARTTLTEAIAKSAKASEEHTQAIRELRQTLRDGSGGHRTV